MIFERTAEKSVEVVRIGDSERPAERVARPASAATCLARTRPSIPGTAETTRRRIGPRTGGSLDRSPRSRADRWTAKYRTTTSDSRHTVRVNTSVYLSEKKGDLTFCVELDDLRPPTLPSFCPLRVLVANSSTVVIEHPVHRPEERSRAVVSGSAAVYRCLCRTVLVRCYSRNVSRLSREPVDTTSLSRRRGRAGRPVNSATVTIPARHLWPSRQRRRGRSADGLTDGECGVSGRVRRCFFENTELKTLILVLSVESGSTEILHSITPNFITKVVHNFCKN
jgi:hypothetical protein